MAPRRRWGGTDVAIARRAFKQLWISATVWALVFGGTIAASALSYVNSFPDAASRRQLAASTSGDAGISILLGPVTAIDTVGGYTVYKCFVFLTTIGALWGLLAATRLLRGEEDTGRWQLVLAGATRALTGDDRNRGCARRGRRRALRRDDADHVARGAEPRCGIRLRRDRAVRREPRAARRGLRGRRRADRAARPLAAAGHGAGYGGVRFRIRRADDRRLGAEHEVAVVAHAVGLDRADAAVHRERRAPTRARGRDRLRARCRVDAARVAP